MSPTFLARMSWQFVELLNKPRDTGSKLFIGGAWGRRLLGKREMLGCVLGMKRWRCSGSASGVSRTPGGSSRASGHWAPPGWGEDRAGEMHTRVLGVTEPRCG